MRADFVNLTRGLLCCQPEHPHYLRIQSTWCEQKRWADILWTVGPDLMMHLALGSDVVIHDVSERPRKTRAVWQGMVWVRYACERAWGVHPQPAIMRGGHDETRYFARAFDSLDDRVRKHVAYFSQFHRGQSLTYSTCPHSVIAPALAMAASL